MLLSTCLCSSYSAMIIAMGIVKNLHNWASVSTGTPARFLETTRNFLSVYYRAEGNFKDRRWVKGSVAHDWFDKNQWDWRRSENRSSQRYNTRANQVSIVWWKECHLVVKLLYIGANMLTISKQPIPLQSLPIDKSIKHQVKMCQYEHVVRLKVYFLKKVERLYNSVISQVNTFRLTHKVMLENSHAQSWDMDATSLIFYQFILYYFIDRLQI